MKLLTGLKSGDPVVYERLGDRLNCDFIELAVVRGKNVAVVWCERRGLFLAPPSCIRISSKLERVL